MMKQSLETRLARLEAYKPETVPDVFICDDNSVFSVSDALDYIMTHGRETGDGRTIIDIISPDDTRCDSVSKSINEFVQETVRGAEWTTTGLAEVING